ncbi:MAG: exosortase/archaeosortase family protein [Conexivisphaerales archaeon]
MGFLVNSRFFVILTNTKGLLSKLQNPPVIVYFIIFILLIFLIDPSSFLQSWNDGNGALIAIIPLAILELREKCLLSMKSRRRALTSYALIISSAASIYLIELRLSNEVAGLAIGLGVEPSIAYYSWVQALIFGISAAAIFYVSLAFDNKFVLPGLYTASLMLFLFFDTFFPFDEIGILQGTVTPVLQLAAFLVNHSGMGYASAYNNLLRLSNSTGSTTLAVYWPSAGVEGMIIALLIVFAFTIKMNISNRRRLAYLSLGLLIAYLANSLRLLVLSLYVLQDVSNVTSFERFHSVIGDLIFFPCLALLLFEIYRIEKGRERIVLM